MKIFNVRICLCRCCCVVVIVHRTLKSCSFFAHPVSASLFDERFLCPYMFAPSPTEYIQQQQTICAPCVPCFNANSLSVHFHSFFLLCSLVWMCFCLIKNMKKNFFSRCRKRKLVCRQEFARVCVHERKCQRSEVSEWKMRRASRSVSEWVYGEKKGFAL